VAAYHRLKTGHTSKPVVVKNPRSTTKFYQALVKDADGKILTDPEQIKERIAQRNEGLYGREFRGTDLSKPWLDIPVIRVSQKFALSFGEQRTINHRDWIK